MIAISAFQLRSCWCALVISGSSSHADPARTSMFKIRRQSRMQVSIGASGTADDGAAAPPLVHAAETGGALAGLRVVAITSGRGESSRGAAVLVSCLG